ncbi:LacI family transcriptional regulator [Sphingobium sp. Leaf26]|nr:LacI family DNA-binding transcriptional regulator [Sphingobium sp. Leaf26]KQM97311.1 LacI family transcriptional regulator [Sphingobium sp. Leaf26]
MEQPAASSLAELARIAGVSISTVSRSLSGNPNIARATRERIEALARTHGFQINRAARNLRLKRTGAIGVVLPLGHETQQHLSDPFFMSLIGPLADTLTERGYDLLLSRVIPTEPGWLDHMVDGGRVDGLLLIGQSDQIDTIERVAARYMPLVIWGAVVDGYSQLTVGSDNVAGGRIATEHLLAQGRRNLAFFGNPDVPEFAARLSGFRQAMARDGLGEGLLLPAHLTTEAAYEAIRTFLAQNPPIDGIVAASDVIAMSALRALSDAGLHVPDDVAVVGYDDVMIAAQTTPPLTTIRQDVARGASLMVDLLFERMSGGAAASVCMTPQLVQRASA